MARETSPDSRRTALIVLGMQGAGISTLAGLLVKLGAQEPLDPMAATEDSLRGYWESGELMRPHDRLRESASSRWNDWEQFNPGWHMSPAASAFLEELQVAIARESEGAPLLLVKDPRISSFPSFWMESLQAFDISPKPIFSVRDPFEASNSLERQDGVSPKLALLLWLRHVLDAEAGTRGLMRAFVSHTRLLEDWRGEIARITEALQVTWPRWSNAVELEIDQHLTASLRNNQTKGVLSSGEPLLDRWINDTHSAMTRLANEQEEDQAIFALLDEIRGDFARSASTFASVFKEAELAHVLQVDAVSADTSELDAKLATINRSNRAITEQIEQIEQEPAKEQQTLQILSSQCADLKTQLETQAHQASRQELQLTKLEALCAFVSRKIESDAANASEAVRLLSQRVDEQAVRIGSLDSGLCEAQQGSAICRDLLERQEQRLQSDASAQTSLRLAENSLEAYSRHLKSARSEIAQLQAALSKQSRDARHRIESLEATLILLRDELDHQRRTAVDVGDQLHALSASRYRMFRALLRPLRLPEHDDEWGRQIERVRESANFDSDWYLATYPDVSAAGIDPVVHYVRHGASEGRNPSPRFDTAAYMEDHPDLQRLGLNPLAHHSAMTMEPIEVQIGDSPDREKLVHPSDAGSD